MIEVKRMAAQGDVLFRCIVELPADVVEVSSAQPLVVAHSETGHHHRAVGDEVRLFERATRDPLVCYLRVDGDFADIVHDRTFHTHETLRLLPGIWEVRRQREWTGGSLWAGTKATMPAARTPVAASGLTRAAVPTPTPTPADDWALVMD